MRKVVFTLRENYVIHLSVALYSLFVNNPNDKFCISVFTDDFSDESERKITKLVRSFNSKFEVVKLKSEVFNNLTFTFHFAPVNYFRLHIHKYYADDVILYLDVDIIINGAISDLFNYSIDNYYLAAVPELTFDRFDSLNMKSSSSYFNAGVILINNKKWREDNFGDKVIEYLVENKNVIMMADQDGLNSIIDGDFLKLPAKYNMQNENFYNLKSIQVRESLILHFSGSHKPWHLINRAPKHPLWYMYWYYRFRLNLNFFIDTLSGSGI